MRDVRAPHTIHGDADQIVPFAAAGAAAAKIVPGSTFKDYPGTPHGLPITEKDTVNADPESGVRREKSWHGGWM